MEALLLLTRMLTTIIALFVDNRTERGNYSNNMLQPWTKNKQHMKCTALNKYVNIFQYPTEQKDIKI